MSDSDTMLSLRERLLRGDITPAEFRAALAETIQAPVAELPSRPAFEDVADALADGRLVGADLARVNWRKKSLPQAVLRGADFSKAKLSKTDFTGADLAGANFAGADLAGAILAGADLTGAILDAAMLKDADLTGAKLVGALAKNISSPGADFSGVDARRAELGFADMPRVNLTGADFSGADLSDANLSDSRLVETKLNDATLTRANLQNVQVERVTARGIDAARLNLNLAAVTDTDFSGAELNRADISNAFLERVSFADAKLGGATFNVSEHREVDLNGADLAGTSFKSMVGYTEDDLNVLAQRGANVDRFLVRRFFRLLWRSHWAQAAVALVLLAAGVGLYFHFNNPATWGYAKLERVAQDRRGNADFAGAEELYRIMLTNYSEHASKVAATRNALARLLMDTKRFDEAESLFNSVVADFPDQTGSVLNAEIGIADLLREQRQFDAAEQTLLGITEKFAEHPQVIDAWDRLAKLAKLQGRTDRAREIYEQVIAQTALDENSIIRAQFELAQMLQENKDYEGAIAKYREIVSRFEDSRTGATALSAIIQLEVERQNLQAAARLLDELKSTYPDETDSVLDGEIFYASALLNDSNYEQEGLARLQKIYDANVNTAKGYWAGKGIAEYYKRVEKYDQATAILAKLTAAFDANLHHRIELVAASAELELLQNRPAAALERLATVKDKLSEPGQARIILDLEARSQAANGDVQQAQVTFRRLAELFPEDPGTRLSALLGEAGLLATAGRDDEAIALYRQAAEAADQPGSRFDAWQHVAEILRAGEDEAGERRELVGMQKAFADEPMVLAQVLLLLAENHRRQNEVDDALRILRQVADMNTPNRPVDALQAMLRIRSEQGDAAAVATLHKEIIERFPQDRRARLNAQIETAGLLARGGDVAAATAEYQALAEAGEPNFRRQALLSLLQLFVEQGRSEDADRTFATLKDELPPAHDDLANATLVYAQRLRRTGRGEEAAALYNELLGRFDGKVHSLWALGGLAQYRLEQGRPTDAQAAYERLLGAAIIDKYPEEATRARQGLGMIAETRRDYVGALVEYEKALTLVRSADERLTVQQAIVRALSEQGKIDEARALVDRMRQDNPRRPGDVQAAELNVLGALARNNRFAEALTGYEAIAGATKEPTVLSAALHAIAQTQLAAGRLAEAEKAYERLRRAFADDGEQLRSVDLGLAGIYRQRSDFDRALKLYEKARDTYEDASTRRQAMAAIGGIHAELGRLDKAREIYNELLEDAADTPISRATALMGLADLDGRGGDLARAIATYRQVLELSVPEDTKIGVYHALAQLYVQQGQFAQARAIYEELGDNYPQNVEHLAAARFGEAETMRQNGDFDNALTVYNEVVEKSADPTIKARARVAIGRTYLDKKDFKQAQAAFEAVSNDATVLAAQKLEARAALADVLRQTGDLDAAAQTYQTLVEDTADENAKHNARQALASIRMEQGRFDDAEAIYQAMTQAKTGAASRRIEGLMGLADAAMRRGDYAKARELYTRVRRDSPGAQHDLNALTAIAQSYVAESKFAPAIATYDEILDKHGDNRQARVDAELGKAHLLRDQGKFDQALGAYQKIVDENDKATQVYWALSAIAQIHGQRGDVESAEKAYQEINRRFPENNTGLADARLNRANGLKNGGRRDEAQSAYEEITKQFAGSQQAAAAIEGLAQIGVEFQDFAQAETNFQRLLKEYGKDPSAAFRARLGLANLARQKGQPSAALTGLNEALDLAKQPSDRIQTLVFIAQTDQELGQTQQAEATYQRLLSEFPKNEWARSEALMGRGNLRMANAQFAEAAELFAQIADEYRGRPAASGGLQALAGAEIALGREDRLDGIIERLTKEHGEDPNAAINVHMSLVNKLLAERRFDEVDARLAGVVKQYAGLPQTAWVRHAQAQSALAQQQFGRAADIFSQIKEEFPGNRTAVIDADLGLADLARIRGETDTALGLYEEMAKRYPGYGQAVRALQAMADIYGLRGDVSGQAAALSRIVNEHEGDREAVLNAHLALGNLQKARNRFPEALAEYKAIYEQQPTADQAAWAKTAAARVYFQIGEEKVAEELLRDVIDAFPDDNEAVVGAKQFLAEIYDRN